MKGINAIGLLYVLVKKHKTMKVMVKKQKSILKFKKGEDSKGKVVKE